MRRINRENLDAIEEWIDWPAWAADAVVTDVGVHLAWRDRLLVLIGRPLTITVKAFTECRTGRTEGRSRVNVARIRWPWSRPAFGIAEAGPER